MVNSMEDRHWGVSRPVLSDARCQNFHGEEGMIVVDVFHLDNTRGEGEVSLAVGSLDNYDVGGAVLAV